MMVRMITESKARYYTPSWKFKRHAERYMALMKPKNTRKHAERKRLLSQ